MKTLTAPILLLLLLTLASCTNCDKKIFSCPDLDADNVNWIKLHESNSFTFENSEGVSRIFTGSTVQISHETSSFCKSSGVGTCNCFGCESEASLILTETSDTIPNYIINLRHSQSKEEEEDPLSSRMSLVTMSKATQSFDIPIVAGPDVEMLTDVTLGQRTYDTLYKIHFITSDSLVNLEASFFYLTNEEAIVGFKETDVEEVFYRVW